MFVILKPSKYQSRDQQEIIMESQYYSMRLSHRIRVSGSNNRDTSH